MLIARIAMPDALYGASVSAKTFESINESITNPIDFNDVVDVYLTKAIGGISHSHIPCFDAYSRNFSKSVKRSHFLGGKEVDKSKPILRVGIYCIRKKRPINLYRMGKLP